MIPMPTSLRIVKGGNPVSTQGVRGNVPLVTVDLGRQPKSIKRSPHLEVAAWRCDVRRYLIQKYIIILKGTEKANIINLQGLSL